MYFALFSSRSCPGIDRCVAGADLCISARRQLARRCCSAPSRCPSPRRPGAPDLSLEQLIALPVEARASTSGSRWSAPQNTEQTKDRVAAAVTAITRDEIRSSAGARSTRGARHPPGVHHLRPPVFLRRRARLRLAGDYADARAGHHRRRARQRADVRRRPISVACCRSTWTWSRRIEFIPARRRDLWPERHVRRRQCDHPQGCGTRRRRVLGFVAVAAGDAQGAQASWGKRLDNELELMVSATVLRSDGDDLDGLRQWRQRYGARPGRRATRSSTSARAAPVGPSGSRTATAARTTPPACSAPTPSPRAPSRATATPSPTSATVPRSPTPCRCRRAPSPATTATRAP